ncbi:MAG: helix-turn-helix domain-containing protein [Desulfobacterales bacterium]|jgi:predicted XRE-type DNA-binding protein|nr:helix-turn-helix domain-containing protein [Desulfobacterales bacterium]
MKHKNIGSSFDDFLKENDILEHAEAVATKRVVAYQLREEMKKRKISQAKLAKQMETSRSSVNRLLDPDNESLTIKTLKRAAATLGKRVLIRLV